MARACVVAILIPSLALLILLRPQSASAFDEQAGGQKEAPATAETRAEAARRAQNEAAKAIAAQQGRVRETESSLAAEYTALGELQHQQGRLTDAVKSYTSAIQLAEKLAPANGAAPDSQRSLARNYANLAVVEQRLDRWEDAEASYRKAIATQAKLVATQPEVADNSGMLASLHFYFGIAERDHGNLLVAEQSLTKAIELFTSLIDVQPAVKPSLIHSCCALADTLAVAARWQEAADAYGQTIEMDPQTREFRSRRAILQWAAGDKAGYQATCADLIERHGDTKNVVDGLWIAQACVVGDDSVADMERVVALAERTAAAQPRNPVAKTLVGAAQFRAGKTEEAIAILKEALPQHALASLAAPKQRTHIRISRLLGESFLALAYQKQGNREEFDKQIKTVRGQLANLDKARPDQADGLLPWSIHAVFVIVDRELAQLDEAAKQQ